MNRIIKDCIGCAALEGVAEGYSDWDINTLILNAQVVLDIARRVPRQVVMPAAQALAAYNALNELRKTVVKAIYSFISVSIYDRDREWNDLWLDIRDDYQATFATNMGRYVGVLTFARDTPTMTRIAMPDAGYGAGLAAEVKSAIDTLNAMKVFKLALAPFVSAEGRNWMDDMGDALVGAGGAIKGLIVAIINAAADVAEGAKKALGLFGWLAKNAVQIAVIGGGIWAGDKLLSQGERKTAK